MSATASHVARCPWAEPGAGNGGSQPGGPLLCCRGTSSSWDRPGLRVQLKHLLGTTSSRGQAARTLILNPESRFNTGGRGQLSQGYDTGPWNQKGARVEGTEHCKRAGRVAARPWTHSRQPPPATLFLLLRPLTPPGPWENQ